jgi:phage baseplate assembly protein W
LEDEKKLSESWLALLSPVQKLAATSYGGRTMGSGLALHELLNKALMEAQQYNMEDQTREMFKNFPRLTITEIASKSGLDRSHFSRRYRTRATELLTKAFLRVIDRSS